MRIAVVSAHFPPNFVSGGTLVPQRIAEGLAGRGHEVLVYAGSVDDGHPDLTVRTERRADGLTVRWLTVTGMLAWDDDRNFANDAVDADFARWLADVQPDVVHFHSLQGLGAGLLSVARASGAATVLTMHDLWWWCARQFLVERSMRPCATVVDCGVCPCERDNAWLTDRNGRLARHLANADLVLSPSATMLDLLAANGVDPGRLALDENPSPESVRRAADRDRARTGPGVRFVFAGGSHPVKGGGVALDAARELADLDGWSLDMFGMGDPGGTPLGPLPAQVRLLPPYDPDDVTRVLGGYDVLLMSSVMLESYSLLTREALAAGCAVITADNPGPTEVVRDGVGGLVVPRGDAPALARAMRRVVTEPGLLDAVRPEPGTLPLRSLDAQLDDLLDHYERLRARTTAPARTSWSTGPDAGGGPGGIGRVLIVSGITGAPLRYRGYLAQEALETVGVRSEVLMYRDPAVLAAARRADAVVFYRVPATDQVLDVIGMVRDRPDPVPVLGDIDDLIFDPGLRDELDPILTAVPGLDLDLYWQGVRRYRTTLEATDAFIGSTELLCRRATELIGLPAFRWANGVGRHVARASDVALRRARARGPIRIGYLSGTNTHNEDWAWIEPAVVEVLRRRPSVELWLGGLLEPSAALDEFGGRVRRLPFRTWHQLPAVLRDLDVNLAPLAPDRIFNEAKSAIKWLEAALTATPTVASPSQPFREAIVPGRTGVLAARPDDWVDAVLGLVDDAAARDQLGLAARQQALLALSPARQGHRYLAALHAARRTVLTQGHRRPSDGWIPETLSEPSIPQRPDRYGPVLRAGNGGRAPAAVGPLRALRHRLAGRTSR
ncbi:glycosyltransferase [Nakamurella leprariae]|uniref:Glycosyltransferase n=1 Tax=Nakamurella leprariae TaxID=2803911 RepID=A0A938YG10_9ACTN|nr:glycosyltransferase [Nakamurella leprariae]MBM9467707.1 glycosyltransferase [Nakamurella leprariae]